MCHGNTYKSSVRPIYMHVRTWVLARYRDMQSDVRLSTSRSWLEILSQLEHGSTNPAVDFWLLVVLAWLVGIGVGFDLDSADRYLAPVDVPHVEGLMLDHADTMVLRRGNTSAWLISRDQIIGDDGSNLVGRHIPIRSDLPIAEVVEQLVVGESIF